MFCYFSFENVSVVHPNLEATLPPTNEIFPEKSDKKLNFCSSILSDNCDVSYEKLTNVKIFILS
jgi:hypothetical protein